MLIIYSLGQYLCNMIANELCSSPVFWTAYRNMKRKEIEHRAFKQYESKRILCHGYAIGIMFFYQFKSLYLIFEVYN